LLFFNLCIEFSICVLHAVKIVYFLSEIGLNLIPLLEQIFNVAFCQKFQMLFIFFYIFFCFFLYFILYSFIIFSSIYYI
jgi:hypothetical protein